MLNNKPNNTIDYGNIALASDLIINCEKCCGLCCVALYRAAIDGFPENKAVGDPCGNLMEDFRCAVHSQLPQLGMKGCLAYDCFGAGQKVTELYKPYGNWKTVSEQAQEIFDVFLIVYHLHQMLWYLLDALSFIEDETLQTTIKLLIEENEQITSQTPQRIVNTKLGDYKNKVNQLLKKVTETVTYKTSSSKQGKNFLGKDFKRSNLNGRDFSMSLMIAANLEGCSLHRTNFLGADMRDANIKNADLSSSMFLTQMQINTAKGNAHTKLPTNISRPLTWFE